MADHPDQIRGRSSEEEYVHHLLQAQYHIHRALEQVDRPNGPRRSLVCKALLRKAHGILSGLYMQESRNQGS